MVEHARYSSVLAPETDVIMPHHLPRFPQPQSSQSPLSKCCRSPNRKDLLRALWYPMREREFEVFRDKLFDVGSFDLIGIFKFDDSEDVDRPEPSTMSSCHILVQSLNRISSRHLSVFLVHVVSSGARIVSNPDAKVLDFHWSLFMDLWGRIVLAEQLAGILIFSPRTTFRLTISPFDFLTFRSFIKKYQNRDFATTVLGAKMRMR